MESEKRAYFFYGLLLILYGRTKLLLLASAVVRERKPNEEKQKSDKHFSPSKKACALFESAYIRQADHTLFKDYASYRLHFPPL
jgi:hypothetical protein